MSIKRIVKCEECTAQQDLDAPSKSAWFSVRTAQTNGVMIIPGVVDFKDNEHCCSWEHATVNARRRMGKEFVSKTGKQAVRKIDDEDDDEAEEV